jgi:hypothetical protein
MIIASLKQYRDVTGTFATFEEKKLSLFRKSANEETDSEIIE